MPRLTFLIAALALSLAWFTVPAIADDDVPYAKLGDVLGTPKLAYSLGPKDKSQLLLKFVRDGEDDQARDFQAVGDEPPVALARHGARFHMLGNISPAAGCGRKS